MGKHYNTIENSELFKKGLRRCYTCWEVKPVTDFYKNSKDPSGYGIYCKVCGRKRALDSHNVRYTNSEAGRARLARYDDETLYQELYRRGYRGRLTKPAYLGEAYNGPEGSKTLKSGK